VVLVCNGKTYRTNLNWSELHSLRTLRDVFSLRPLRFCFFGFAFTASREHLLPLAISYKVMYFAFVGNADK
jgi:hypothetical protein